MPHLPSPAHFRSQSPNSPPLLLVEEKRDILQSETPGLDDDKVRDDDLDEVGDDEDDIVLPPDGAEGNGVDWSPDQLRLGIEGNWGCVGG